MTRGVLLVANNNESIDYILQACFSAKHIKKYLKLPVTLITDTPELMDVKYNEYMHLFDSIIKHIPSEEYTTKIYRDGVFNTTSLKFKNSSRASVFDLTPYDETVVLDTDVLIFNDNFLKCFNQQHDFLIYRDAVDVCYGRSDNEFKFISDSSVDFYWATCIFFRKTENNKIFFDLVKHIQENWNHYRILYQIATSVYRNDFAFSIAIHIMNGGSTGNFAKAFPGKLLYSTDCDELVEVYADGMLLLIEKLGMVNEQTPLKITGANIHFMNKFSLDRMIKNDN